MDEALTHLDERGSARMVDITGKPPSTRRATARCQVHTTPQALAAIEAGRSTGELLVLARAAGTQAAKQTAYLIPLCHSIRLDAIEVDIRPLSSGFEVEAVAVVHERTGVEMEALTACAISSLTLLAAVLELDPTASIGELALWEKRGGRSGTWLRPGPG